MATSPELRDRSRARITVASRRQQVIAANRQKTQSVADIRVFVRLPELQLAPTEQDTQMKDGEARTYRQQSETCRDELMQ